MVSTWLNVATLFVAIIIILFKEYEGATVNDQTTVDIESFARKPTFSKETAEAMGKCRDGKSVKERSRMSSKGKRVVTGVDEYSNLIDDADMEGFKSDGERSGFPRTRFNKSLSFNMHKGFPAQHRFRRQAELSPFWRAVRDFFPDVDICLDDHNTTTRMGSYAIKQRCSTGCSCSPSCHTDNSCCFPSYDVANSSGPNNLTCVSTVAYDQHSTINSPSFYQVTHCPDGSVPDITDAPFGFYNITPVFSPSSRLIYQNERILQCHGLNDGIFWNLEIKCRSYVGRSIPFFLLIDSDIRMIKMLCTVRFFYPYDISDIGPQRCYTSLTQNCQQERHIERRIPKDTGMSASDIVEACQTGPVAPVLAKARVYKNQFCALCYSTGSDFPESNCESDSDFLMSSRPRSITILYRPTELIEMAREVAVRKNISVPSACQPISATNDKVQEKTDCREVYCPSGRVRMADGQCRLTGYSWPYKHYGVCLALTSSIELSQDDIDYLLAYFNQTRKIPLPGDQTAWTAGWRWTELTIRVPDADNRGTEIIGLLLRRRAPENLEQFLADIEHTLNRPFSLIIGTKLVSFQQSLRHSCEFLYVDEASRVCNEYYTVRTDRKIDITIPKATYKCQTIGASTLRWLNEVLIITKMFYCPRVQLKHFEFDEVFPSKLVQVKTHNKTLIADDIEFSMATVHYADQKLRVCAGDLNYESTIKISSSSTRAQLSVFLAGLGFFKRLLCGTVQ